MSNSQYLACLLLFIHHIHTICSLWTIKPTKVRLPTTHNIPRHAFSPKKIVAHWTQKNKKTCDRFHLYLAYKTSENGHHVNFKVTQGIEK